MRFKEVNSSLRYGLSSLIFLCLIGCQPAAQEKGYQTKVDVPVISDTTAEVAADTVALPPDPVPQNLADTTFVDMADLSNAFGYDFRYATEQNFIGEKVYDCVRCLVRYEVAKALLKANDSLRNHNYRIKFFDCFRPHEVQKKMWAIYPVPGYVANPYTSGSVHNKGAAVDISLETLAGDSVHMGTDFDHFSEKAHHAYTGFSEDILANRRLLKGVMEQFGFKSIRTEWWHYNFKSTHRYRIANEPLCD